MSEFELKLGKGLWSQLEKGNKYPYTAVTGARGMEQFNQAIEIDWNRKRLQSLLEKSKVTLSKYANLTKMLDSPDYADAVMAAGVITFKEQ